MRVLLDTNILISFLLTRSGHQSTISQVIQAAVDAKFTLILPELTTPEEAEHIAHRLLDLLRLPFEISGQELFVTGSVGIAICPEDGREWSSLQKNADLAMYRAKTLGRNRHQRFTVDMLSDTSERLVFESIFRRAVERREMELYYQPQYDIDNRLAGFEALMRWNSPQLGFVPPSRFVPIAEETGLIGSRVRRSRGVCGTSGRPARTSSSRSPIAP